MGFGPIVLGYDDPTVCSAIQEQVANGTVYSLAHPRELTVAELLIEVIPCAEMVGFFIGGSAATSGAVRLSRVYTGRDRVITCGITAGTIGHVPAMWGFRKLSAS